VVVTSHGYTGGPEVFEDEPEPWTARGLATVRVRVRGYPPSTIDMPDLRGDWIMHKPPLRLDVAEAWIVRGAVADVMQAVRCASAHFGEDVPLALHGESLGGGLATIAAAQLARMNASPARLMLAMPTFGDWRWRATRYCNGSGGQMNVLLDVLRGDDRARLLEGLLLYDAALHAADITVPTLVRLATMDDVVPAPTAAAIFNAIASVEKWRFITCFGHFDGGIADARRYAVFERAAVEFADSAMSPAEAVRPLLAGMEPSF
jgi:cephalosporin-C deacetylase-like acetyl esterase